MSLWLIGLGASLGYMLFQREQVEGRLDQAVKEYQNAAGEATDGVTMKEIREQWKDTGGTRENHELYHSNLSMQDRQYLQQQESALRQEAVQYDMKQEAAVPEIRGVYLDHVSPF